MSEPHLRLRGVHRHYGVGETMVRVLEAAELEVASGELVAIVAPSGAGKSTLLHLSGLLERPQSGEIEITGTPTFALSERGRTLLRRTTIGYVYQFHHLLPEFSALENVSIPQLIAGKSQAAADKRSHELLDLLQVGGRATHRPAELSGGEQQRVALARALVGNPRVLLADEPTGNLDFRTGESVMALLEEMHAVHGLTSVYVTHNVTFAERADRILKMERGSLHPATAVPAVAHEHPVGGEF